MARNLKGTKLDAPVKETNGQVIRKGKKQMMNLESNHDIQKKKRIQNQKEKSYAEA